MIILSKFFQVLGAGLCASLICLSLTVLPDGVLPVKASSNVTNSEIEAAKDRKAAIEAKQKAAEADLAELESKKDDISDYIEALDKKLEKLLDDMTTLKTQYKAKKKELAETRKDLEAAKQAESDQYDTMKERIRYMYENGDSDYLDVIFGSDNITDLYNNSEYMADITAYDNDLFDKYTAAKKEVAEKEKLEETQLADLKQMYAEYKIDKQTNETLLADKQTELANVNSLVDEQNSKITELASAAEAQDSTIDSLIAKEEARREAEKKAAEEAARKKEEEEERKRQEAAAAANNQNNGNNSAEDSSDGSSADYSASVNSSSGVSLIWPMPASHTITSGFGSRAEVTANSGTFHSGVDIGVAAGTPIIAAAGGTVVEAGYHWSMGNYVLISHGNGVYTVYMHCSKLLVSSGQNVSQGQQIGLVGSTGVATGPHLHFGLKINGTYVNPLNYVN